MKILLISFLLFVGCSNKTLHHNAAIPSRNISVDTTKLLVQANIAWAEERKSLPNAGLPVDYRYRQWGFSDSAEMASSTLGKPFLQYNMRLEAIQSYKQSMDIDISRFLCASNIWVFPVISKNTVHGCVGLDPAVTHIGSMNTVDINDIVEIDSYLPDSEGFEKYLLCITIPHVGDLGQFLFVKKGGHYYFHPTKRTESDLNLTSKYYLKSHGIYTIDEMMPIIQKAISNNSKGEKLLQ